MTTKLHISEQTLKQLGLRKGATGADVVAALSESVHSGLEISTSPRSSGATATPTGPGADDVRQWISGAFPGLEVAIEESDLQ